MTEHAINNGTSICQTTDATHLLLTFKEFCVNKTLGLTYSGVRADLEFYLVPNYSAPEYCLSLYVNNISDRTWYGLIYKDPLNKQSESTIKEIPAKANVFLYCLREFMFEKDDELIVFLRFGCDNIMLQADDTDQEQMMRLWGCLESLHQDPVFADMTVNGAPAHRALLAAASEPLYRTISALTNRTYNNRPSAITEPLNDKTDDVYESLDNKKGDIEIDKAGVPQSKTTESFNDKTKDISVSVDTNQNGDLEADNSGAPFDKGSSKAQDSKILTSPKHRKKDKEEAGLNSDAAYCKGTKSINQSNKLIQTDSVKVTVNNTIEEMTSKSGVTENNEEDNQNAQSKPSLDVNVPISVSTDNIPEAPELKKKVLEQEKLRQDMLMKLSEFMGKEVDEVLSKSLSSFLMENNIISKTNNIEAMENPQPDNYTLELPELRFNNPEFLQYIYTGCVEPARSIIDTPFLNLCNDLLAVSQSLMLEGLLRKIERKLIHSLNHNKINNYLPEIMDLAEQYNIHSLKSKLMKIMRSPEVLSHKNIINNPLTQKCILTTPSHRYRRQCCITITLKYPDWQITYSPDSEFYIGGCHSKLEICDLEEDKFDSDVLLHTEKKGRRERSPFRLDIKICPLTNENDKISPMKNEKNDIIWYYESSIMLGKAPDKNRLCCVKDIFKVLHDENKVLVYMEVYEDYEENIDFIVQELIPKPPAVQAIPPTPLHVRPRFL